MLLKQTFQTDKKDFSIFETGRTYFIERETDEKDSGVTERRILAGAMTGDINNEKWIKKPVLDFFSVKGVVQNLLELLGLENRVQFRPCNDKAFFASPIKVQNSLCLANSLWKLASLVKYILF